MAEAKESIVKKGTSPTTRETHWTAAAWLRTNFGKFSELWNWLVIMLIFGAGTFTFLKCPGNLAARFLFAFGQLGLKRLICLIDEDNRSSIRVAEKIGMAFEKEGLDELGPHIFTLQRERIA